MLTVTIPSTELFDERTQEFIYVKEQNLVLEHSLKSLAKWESKWHKPFISRDDRTPEELLDYIKCMTLTQNVKNEIYDCLTVDNINQIVAYMEDPMTATTIREDPTAPKSRRVVTAEIIYYDMIALNIPFECEKWHLNRLLKLIQVCSEMNKPKKKMGRRDLMQRNRSLNNARKKQHGTRG